MTEKRFEEHIENYLISHEEGGLKYHAINHSQYDKDLGLLPTEVIEFIKSSQPKAYGNWQTQFGEDSEEKLLKRLATEIEKKRSN